MAIIPYDRITNLQNDQALAPTDPYPAQKLDQEYNAIKITTDDIIQHLDIIQRDDGQLENDSVGLDQLRDEVKIGFDAPTPWVTDHDYVNGNSVFQANGFWFCLVNHHSTVFADDYAAGFWSLIADFSTVATVGAPMYVSDGPPPLPQQGVQWYESDTGNTYIWYIDPGGGVGQWVHINSGGGGFGDQSFFITPQQLGAVGNGVANDTAALQAAIDLCAVQNRSLYIPAGTYLFNATLVVKVGLRIWGEGERVTVLLFSGAGSALLINPDGTYPNDNIAYSFSDFTINHTTPNGGTYGIQVLTSGTNFVRDWMFERIYIGPFGQAGFLLNNTGTTGPFFGTIHRCYIENGFLGINVGDSVSITSTQIHAQGEHIGINLTQLDGTRQFTIRDCNITCQGGGIYLNNTVGVNIFNTWVEHPYYYGNHLGTLLGQIHLQTASHTKIQGCTVATLAGVVGVTSTQYALWVSNGSNANVILENESGVGESGYHIGIASGASGNKIDSGQRDTGGGVVLITDAGTATENAATQWTDFTCPVDATAGATPTSAAAAGRYRLEGKTVFIEYDITVTTNGAATGALVVTLPFATKGRVFLSGWHDLPTQFGVGGLIVTGATDVLIRKTSDGSYPAVNGSRIALTGTYQRQ